ncbi:hypothetical protein VTN00DRAFT_3598 [Thermoascus crustaceus]|uniref:uncharacterized protein n=1 Tax=Thermoascus crustaceus TaxID=5088 RepID=UPI0037437296
MSDPPTPYRHIAPGPSPPAISPSGESTRQLPANWKKRVSTACLACKKSKRKCSGVPPCDNCRALNRECIFDESLDQRRRVAAKRTAEELNYHRDMLNDLFKVIRSAEQAHAMKLLDIIRNDATPEEIRAYIDETLATMQASGEITSDRRSRETTAKLKDIRRMVNLQGPSPSFRRKVMDVHFLCDAPPIKVPAKPWTTVTDDDDIISHLVSLYFTWDYPFYAFLDCNVFVKHMAAANLDTEFCSPFLVNALLANACHFSEFSEAYAVPGDVMTKGADFLTEAERLWEQEENKKTSLSVLQGTLLLYERYSMFGKDDLGYIMLNRAIEIGKSLGYVDGDSLVETDGLSPDIEESSKRTAWGLFQLDTVVHTNFLRPNHIHHVRLKRPSRAPPTEDGVPWIPYPTHRAPRPAYHSQFFDEACSLSEISSDISRGLFSEGSPVRASQPDETALALYDRLNRWHEQLPDFFGRDKTPAPHILLLHMRYHTSIITLFTCRRKSEPEQQKSPEGSASPASEGSQQQKSPETKTSPTSAQPTTPSGISSTETTLSSARSIAELVRIHRREYGMSRSHAFALYAVNLALFVLLDHYPDHFNLFDDQDFLSLAAAFSIISSRSILGRNMYHIFRQSVRSKAKVAGTAAKAKEPATRLPDEIKDLILGADEEEPSPASASSVSTAGTAFSITKGPSSAASGGGSPESDEDDRRSGAMEVEEETGGKREGQGAGGLSVCEMLERYEALSLGKDERDERK